MGLMDDIKINIGPPPTEKTLEQKLEDFIRQPMTDQNKAEIERIIHEHVRKIEEENEVRFPIHTGVTARELRGLAYDVWHEVPDEAEAVITRNKITASFDYGRHSLNFKVAPAGRWHWPGGAEALQENHALAAAMRSGLL